MKLLTVVIPMYQVEKYIEQCLESFVVPELLDELEVLVINDATPDHSRELAVEYQKRYPNTFRIIDKENGGHGSTINRGIEEAAGRYFKVVDGDDWVDQTGLRHLVALLRKTNADMVLSNYVWVDEKTRKKRMEVSNICPVMEPEKEYPVDAVADHIFMKMHAITYKTSLLKGQGERLDEHCFYVDMEYILFPLPYVKTVVSLPDVVYQYRVGLSGQSMSLENMRKRCSQHERVLNRLLAFYDGLQEEQRSNLMEMTIARMAVSQYKIYLSFRESYRSSLIAMEQRLQKDYPAIYTKVRQKAILLLRKTHYISYPLVSLLVRKMAGG